MCSEREGVKEEERKRGTKEKINETFFEGNI
jgi:hypothetical protein